jgi:hypothetical protein
MVWASMRSFVALPPGMACRSRACPRTQGIPCRAHRSASQVPRAETCHATDEVLLIRSDGLEKRFGSGLPMAVPYDLPVLLQETTVHGAGVPVDATITLVRLRVKSPEVSSSPEVVFPSPSIPRGLRRRGPQSVSKACRRRLLASAPLPLSAAPDARRSATHQPGCQYDRAVIRLHPRNICTMYAEGAWYVHEAPAEYL